MAFTVPNRPDGVAQDQAEPDKGDFQTLGYQKSGVLTGGATTRSAANTVTVGAITGYLNGEYFSVSSDTVLPSFTAPPSGNAKFVLILVQKSGSTFSVYGEQGTAANKGQSATNAMFPNDVDYSAKMLIAAVYYASGDTDISASSIVDKRVFVLPQANPQGVTSTPGDDVGALGEIRVDTSQSLANGQSNVWIKTATAGTGRWTNLGKYALNSDGSDGDAATITIGTVSTGAPGSAAKVENRGTSTAAILDFTIPGGASGGGSVGAAGTITVASAVTTLAAGSNASVAVSGTPQARHLAFSIPRGADGSGASYDRWRLTADGSSHDVAGYGNVTLDAGDGIDLTHVDGTVTIAATAAASSYSFKTTAGGLNPQQEIGNGGLVSFIGGTEMMVVQSGSTFTFNYVGAGTYLPKSAGPSHPITGYLYTGHLTPTSHATFNIGGSSATRYKHGYFSGTVYCNTVSESSDLALKEDIEEAPGLDFVTSLKPLSYRFKDSPAKRHWGFGAQDVEAVCDDTAGIVHKDENSMGLAYSEFTAPIVKAIQELTERLEALENG